MRQSSATPPCSSRAIPGWFPGTMSRRLFNTSRHGTSATYLGNLCQHLVTLAVKKCFLLFSGNSLCPLPLVLALAPLGRAWLSSLGVLFHVWMYLPWLFSSPG